ncbi:hypothetical protein GCM10008949_53270 [Deinococcus humi]|nr:hypothetical protein GCM10008949_53270 [Deinococcus humi]
MVMGVFPETTPETRVLAAPLADLRAQPTPAGLQLRPTRDDQHFDQAQDAYDAVDAQHPEHVEHAQLLSRDDLATCIQAGTMFDVLWNGVWSGYAGTLPKTKLGFPAQSVQELLLTPQARGQGLGGALGPLLAQALPEDGRVLFGTIHGGNVGARRAALSAGRIDLGGWNWLSLA